MVKTATCLFAALLTLALVSTTTTVAGGQDRPAREDYDSGAYLYRAFCASCHGQTGKGDGPVADLSPKPPPDLTVLSRNHGGTFPRDEVRAVLEGRKQVPGHDDKSMPNWPDVLRRTERDDRLVPRRIEALIDHLESMQISR